MAKENNEKKVEKKIRNGATITGEFVIQYPKIDDNDVSIMDYIELSFKKYNILTKTSHLLMFTFSKGDINKLYNFLVHCYYNSNGLQLLLHSQFEIDSIKEMYEVLVESMPEFSFDFKKRSDDSILYIITTPHA
ncbi:MAG: hypothetical protein IKG42_01960 [Clostridia bacterium]|nr:hypothetical protein [Clostridia bacterium]